MAVFAAVFLAAALVARGCGSSEPVVSRREAVEIAKRTVDYEPAGIGVRNVPRSIRADRAWAVSLYTLDGEGRIDRHMVVIVDARTGEVEDIRRER